MKDSIDIDKLSELARIQVSKEEAKELQKDIESILEYVKQVQEISDETNQKQEVGEVYNVLREDSEPHEPGKYTEELMREVPQTKDTENGTHVVVKKIL